MQVALGRLHLTIAVDHHDEPRHIVPDSQSEALEHMYLHEQRLQQVEAERDTYTSRVHQGDPDPRQDTTYPPGTCNLPDAHHWLPVHAVANTGITLSRDTC